VTEAQHDVNAAGPPASYLFVPATRPDRIDKALRSGADEVIVDLEDAVGAADKEHARQLLCSVAPDRSVHVRVNALGSRDFDGDLRVVAGLAWVSVVVVPKVEAAADVGMVVSVLPARVRVVALIESARGLVAVDDIARSGADRLMLGSADYLADIGARPSREALSYPRSRLVVASRAAGLPAPVDGPCLAVGDDLVVRDEAEDARALGLGAKLCIHPTQVPIVNAVFGPTDEDRRWATAVLRAAEQGGGGAFVLDGAMVDEAVLVRARQLVSLRGPTRSPAGLGDSDVGSPGGPGWMVKDA